MPKIKKNSRGTWEFVVDLGRDPATGHRQQARRSGFRTKKEAEEELRRLQNEADKGIVIKKREGNITFEEFSKDWLEWYAATAGVKESTITTRMRQLNMAYKLIGSLKIKDFNKNTYDKFLTAGNNIYAKSTLNNIGIAVSMVLDYAVECGYLPVNPSHSTKKPKQAATLEDIPEDIEEKYLTRAEVDRLLTATKEYGDFQLYTLIHLLIFTGLRIGEALALEFKHCDFKNGVIKVRQTFSSGMASAPKKRKLQTPKTISSVRDVDIDNQTLELLKTQITEQKKKRLKAGAVWHIDNDFIFTSPTNPGGALSYFAVSKHTKRLVEAVGITKRVTLHTLRHTHASLLAESGATLEQIQSRLGHRNDKTTREIYLHITKDSSAKMITNFARFMQM